MEEDKKEEIKEEKRKLEEEGKQAAWIIGIMIGLVVLVLVVYFMIKGMATFNYKGLTFTREKFGELMVYHYFYYFNDSSGQIYKYNLYLRNDPRDNNVPVDGTPLEFNKGKRVYISLNKSGIKDCNDSVIAVTELAGFLANNKIDVRGATVNKSEFEANLTKYYATCENNPNDKVIVIESGNETKIVAKGDCYRIRVADCNILNATEKFEVQAILDAKSSS